jgi:hypothetical protein
MSGFRADFFYSLRLAVQVPPTIFDYEDMMHREGVCDIADEDDQGKYTAKPEKRFHRRRDTIILVDQSDSAGGVSSPKDGKEFFPAGEHHPAEPQTMLLRHIALQSEQFVHNVSEQEGKILISWCQYMVNTVPTAMSSLDLNVSRIQTTAEEVRSRLERREFLSYLEKLFKTYGIRNDENIPDETLRSIFEMFLKPLYLLTSEKREQIRDLMFIFDRNLDGRITQEEFAAVGLDLFVKSGWGDSGDVSLKVSSSLQKDLSYHICKNNCAYHISNSCVSMKESVCHSTSRWLSGTGMPSTICGESWRQRLPCDGLAEI